VGIGKVDATVAGRVSNSSVGEIVGAIQRLWSDQPFVDNGLRLAQWRLVNEWNAETSTNAGVADVIYSAWNHGGAPEKLSRGTEDMLKAEAADIRAIFLACRSRSALAIAGEGRVIQGALQSGWPAAVERASVSPR
jgi:hypothetical protein